MAGYVAKDAPTDHPLTCGFPSSRFASQDAFDPWDSGCGSGKQGGSSLAAVASDVGQPEDQSYAADWMADLESRYNTAAHGGVKFYELGNEPALWDQTHRDIHPSAVSYDELWSKTQAYGAAVKDADPSAKVLGPSEWGWPNYFCSADDVARLGYCSPSAPDRAAHGGAAIAEWLLQRAASYEASHGTRILDYLDLHYYPQGTYGGTGQQSPTEVTRSLWDPSYTDPSWIGDTIDLIPRMRSWVASDYPGTKTSLSEYDLTLATSDPTLKTLNSRPTRSASSPARTSTWRRCGTRLPLRAPSPTPSGSSATTTARTRGSATRGCGPPARTRVACRCTAPCARMTARSPSS